MIENLELLPLTIETIENIMKINVDSLEDIFKEEVLKEMNLKQAIIYNYDSLCFGGISDVKIDIDNIMEAIFFNDDMEINIVNNKEVYGHIAIEKSNNMVLKESYKVYDDKYDNLDIKQYLSTDDDGQAYIKYVKPCRFNEKGNK